MDKNTINNKVISGLAWEGVTKILVQMFTWATTIIVARILSPADYGIVAISGVFIGVLAIVTDMGFMSALINRKEITQEEQDGSFWLSVLLSLFLFIIIYLSAPYIASFYEYSVLVEIIRVSALILPLTSLKIIPTVIAMRNMDFKYRAVTEMIGQFATSISSVVLAMNDYGVWTLVYSVLIGQTVVVIAYLPLLGKIPRPTLKLPKLYGILSYGSHLMGSQILEFFTLRADVLIIGYFLDQKQVGFYSMGFQLATIPLDKIGSMFNRVGFPSISRVKEDTDTARNLFLNMHKYLLLIAFPILVGLLIIADDLVVLLLTDKWSPLVQIIRVLCVLNLLRLSGMLMPYVMAGMGKSAHVFRYQLLSAIVLPAAFLVGAQYGLNGIFIAWFLVYPFLYKYMFNQLSAELRMTMTEFLLSIKSSVVCTCIMLVSVFILKDMFLKDNHLLNLMVMIASGVAFYTLSYYILYRNELWSALRYLRSMRTGRVAD